MSKKSVPISLKFEPDPFIFGNFHINVHLYT